MRSEQVNEYRLRIICKCILPLLARAFAIRSDPDIRTIRWKWSAVMVLSNLVCVLQNGKKKSRARTHTHTNWASTQIDEQLLKHEQQKRDKQTQRQRQKQWNQTNSDSSNRNWATYLSFVSVFREISWCLEPRIQDKVDCDTHATATQRR